jgi:hypothetical protein
MYQNIALPPSSYHDPTIAATTPHQPSLLEGGGVNGGGGGGVGGGGGGGQLRHPPSAINMMHNMSAGSHIYVPIQPDLSYG